MRQVILNSKDDMNWLREVHWPTLSVKYKSAILDGNEDWPTQISAYRRKWPLVTDEPLLRYPAP